MPCKGRHSDYRRAALFPSYGSCHMREKGRNGSNIERGRKMDTRTAAVSLRNVTKTFGAVVANEKVNLDIYKGEILALLGENGSGKTTLMNMMRDRSLSMEKKRLSNHQKMH